MGGNGAGVSAILRGGGGMRERTRDALWAYGIMVVLAVGGAAMVWWLASC